MARALLVTAATSLISSVIEIDPAKPPTPPSGMLLVPFDGPAGAGWRWDGTSAKPPAPSKADYELVLEAMHNALAFNWGYTDTAQAATYIGDPNPKYDAEGRALRAYRSAIWTAAEQILATLDPVNPPTIDQVVAMMPAPPARPVV